MRSRCNAARETSQPFLSGIFLWVLGGARGPRRRTNSLVRFASKRCAYTRAPRAVSNRLKFQGICCSRGVDKWEGSAEGKISSIFVEEIFKIVFQSP
jgi:hypothetical protein